MADDIILEIKGMRLESVAGAVIIDNVDLRLKQGEVWGLMGESGAGKSTIGLATCATRVLFAHLRVRSSWRVMCGLLTQRAGAISRKRSLHRAVAAAHSPGAHLDGPGL